LTINIPGKFSRGKVAPEAEYRFIDIISGHPGARKRRGKEVLLPHLMPLISWILGKRGKVR